MAKTNLFEKAKKTGTTKKVEKHEVVNLPELKDSLSRMAEINAKLAELEAEKATLDGEVREAGKEAMIGLYNSKKSFPETLKVVAGNMSFQFITSDRYLKIDEDRAAELSELYGEEIITEDTKFSFNTAILMKYQDHISDLLMGSKKISDDDKENLLESETSLSITKGTIKELMKYGEDVEPIIEDIQPVFSIKSVQKSDS